MYHQGHHTGSVVSRLFKTAGVLLLLLGSVPAATGQPVDSLRVLWLGNSYTYSNDLPQLTADLAAAASKTLINDSNTPGGYTLAGHSTNATTLGLIAQGGWDYVVLQEQSQIPTIPYWREHSMYPAARLLDSLIVQNGAATMFFMTWGREFGGQQCIDDYCSPDFVDFFHMQDSLASAYRRIAEELEAGLSPVGEGWALARQTNPLADLWSGDHSHPSLEGSYLAACVFYYVLFGESPVGLGYTGGLSQQLAEFYQQIAAGLLEAVVRDSAPPPDFSLPEIRPNPFNPVTTIRFRLPASAPVRLAVYNLRGQLVRLLADRSLPAGWQEVRFDGSGLPGGVYFCDLRVGNRQLSRRMLLLK